MLDVITVPFTILVDQREQKPFDFRGFQANSDKKNADLFVPTMKATLETGDYTISGYELRVAVERKSKSDLISCLTHDRPRFEEQFKRLNELEVAWLIVEANEDSVLQQLSQTNVDLKILNRTRTSWEIKYPRVHWRLCNTVRVAEAHCFRSLEMFYRNDQRKKK